MNKKVSSESVVKDILPYYFKKKGLVKKTKPLIIKYQKLKYDLRKHKL